jgi:hypothetical protein
VALLLFYAGPAGASTSIWSVDLTTTIAGETIPVHFEVVLPVAGGSHGSATDGVQLSHNGTTFSVKHHSSGSAAGCAFTEAYDGSAPIRREGDSSVASGPIAGHVFVDCGGEPVEFPIVGSFVGTTPVVIKSPKTVAPIVATGYGYLSGTLGIIAVACIPVTPCGVVAGAAAIWAGFQAAEYGQIAADPPDMAYRTIVLPAAPPVPVAVAVPGAPPAVTEALTALLANFAQQAATGRALLRSLEKYQGAVIAGDLSWASLQDIMVDQYNGQLALLLNHQPGLRTQLRAAWAAAGLADIPMDAATAAAVKASVQASGLSPALVATLTEAGLGPEAIDALTAAILTMDPDAVTGGFLDALVDPALDAVSLAAAADLAALGTGAPQLISFTVNQPDAHAGTVSVFSAHLSNRGLAETVEFHLGLILPDGNTTLSLLAPNDLTSAVVGALDQPASLRPATGPVSLETPFTFGPETVITYGWSGVEPPGVYNVFLLAIKPGTLADNTLDEGDIVGAGFAPVDFTP